MFCCCTKGVSLGLMIFLLGTFSDCQGFRKSESKGLERGKKYSLFEDGNTLSEGGNPIATCEECGPSVKYGRSVFCCNSNDVSLAVMIPLSTTKESGCKGLEGGRKYVISDTGRMLARCYQCGTSVKFEQSVGIHGYTGDIFAEFTFEPIGDKCLIKSDIGLYAAECHDCWKLGEHSLSVFTHVESPNPESAWTVERHGDFYAFKAHSGKYMTRCRACVPNGTKQDFAFVTATTPIKSALWNVTSV